MRRQHRMPFGAEIDEDGVRFRLWAPAARRVELCLEDREPLPMAAAGRGFYERRTAALGDGARYGYRIDGNDLIVPDPASRSNPDDVHGMSALVDARAHRWRDAEWRGRPWQEAVIYELHVGTFSESGDFDGVAGRLGYLADLGVTAIEIMPIAEFAGGRGWGYDGVLPFAPESRYGGPGAFKRLVESAHAHGLMLILDVVYNHFGPEGNYLPLYAPDFFTDRVETPWGPAIDFESDAGRTVRDFFIHNALYWLEEFNVDGLRIDAVHTVHDRGTPHILEELADTVRAARSPDRHVHLILENDRNEAHYLRANGRGRSRYDAQWNDDFHHAAHVVLTHELDGYLADFAADPVGDLGRCLAQGFVFQGQYSPYRDRPRGEPSADLPTRAFVNFLQNHDQVGNRALGERITELATSEALAAIEAVLLLAPAPPMLFMGQEFAASSPFNYFCDFPPELGAAVAAGRRREFSRFAAFTDPAARERIPNPNSPGTFEQSTLDWRRLEEAPHRDALRRYRELLEIRRAILTPRLPGRRGTLHRPAAGALEIRWALDGGGTWCLLANLGNEPASVPGPAGRRVYAGSGLEAADTASGAPDLTLPAWAVAAYLQA